MSNSESFEQEYHALTSGCGFVEFAELSTVAMTGEDRVSFLHNMCTHDIKRLDVDASCEAFCTDVKGKIVAHVLVANCENSILLLTVPDQAASIIAHLDRYIIREDVQLSDASEDYAWFAAVPGEARTTWSDGEGVRHVLPSVYDSVAVSMIGVAESDRQRTKQTLTNCGLQECGKATWDARRIEDKLPLFGVDFDGSNLPQEVNRDHMAISFDKGCYLGQETVARIDALGHVNQKLVTVQFDGKSVPPVGLELRLHDEIVGRVTSSCWSVKEGAPLALAMVRRAANDEGTQLQSECGLGTVVSSD